MRYDVRRCYPSPMNLRSIASHLVLLTAIAFASVRLWDILSLTCDYLRDAISGIYEPWWFWDCAGDTLSAFYLAFAIRGILQWRRPWRTAFASAGVWLFLAVAYLFSTQYCGILWSTLFVVPVHFGALVYLLITDIHRLGCAHNVKSLLQPRNA